jgi:methyl-accepting chemotaxis protein
MALGNNLETIPTKKNKVKSTPKGASENGNSHVTAEDQDYKQAVNSGWASIEFEPDGTILSANDNFVSAMEYASAKELIGDHHSMLCEGAYTQTQDYKNFWKKLANGEAHSGEFKRISKLGNDVWINASYTPVRDNSGEVYKIIKIATNITDMVAARLAGEHVQSAVDAGWASIEFEPNGTILTANENWIKTTGYSSESEIVGQHHRIFCSNEYGQSSAYKKFWEDLANGHIQSGEFLRQLKNGDDLWIQASYNPVKDASGKVIKVIKIAANISNIKMPVMEVSEIISQMAQGDLTRSFNVPSEGYVKEMGDALNVALDNLNALLGNIEENSNLLGASSEQMLTKSDQMQGTTQEVASAIGQMAEGIQQQAEQIDESSKLLDGVRAAAIEVTDKSQQINDAAEASQNSVGVGLDTVQKVVASMSEIQESAATTSASITVLTERSEEIARTLNVITDIAAQTNLLALNAAIEAARAGDAGRGFAVVAEEIRKLAEDSRKSAGDIEKVISAVGKDISSAGKAISTMDSSVKVGNQASNDAERVFNEISVSTQQTLKFSVDVLASADEQKSNIEDTVKNIEKIVVVSEETAAGTEEIATSSKDLNNGMDEFNATSKSLASIAVQLQKGVSKFILKK